jgi:hypothetical protein
VQRPRIDVDAVRLAHGFLGEPTAEHADGPDARLPRRGRVIRRVADCHRGAALGRELPENDLEDVWRGLGLLRVLRGSGNVDQIGDACDVQVIPKFVFFADVPIAILAPVSRTRRNRSGTAENGPTSGRYSDLNSLPRQTSSSLP